GKNWLLIKADDDEATGSDVAPIVERETRSAISGRSLEEIAEGRESRARSNGRHGKAGVKKPRAAKHGRESPEVVPTGARKAKMPDKVKPQLATLVREAPDGPDWIFELKFDGYRVICRKEMGSVVLRTRAGNDWTHRFPRVARAAAKLPVGQA